MARGGRGGDLVYYGVLAGVSYATYSMALDGALGTGLQRVAFDIRNAIEALQRGAAAGAQSAANPKPAGTPPAGSGSTAPAPTGHPPGASGAAAGFGLPQQQWPFAHNPVDLGPFGGAGFAWDQGTGRVYTIAEGATAGWANTVDQAASKAQAFFG